ncbi:hypothetical protein [Modestobacter italicus]|uniref:hypothetical protein n=1 Tax=Modestobacter italicus (strain DSM 44449 / CECT 9708 / BC 501) TaxID=2732864 RepID=UPI001C967517|nr:hypothetical protein [Modestobacter italicus]
MTTPNRRPPRDLPQLDETHGAPPAEPAARSRPAGNRRHHLGRRRCRCVDRIRRTRVAE